MSSSCSCRLFESARGQKLRAIEACVVALRDVAERIGDLPAGQEIGRVHRGTFVDVVAVDVGEITRLRVVNNACQFDVVFACHVRVLFVVGFVLFRCGTSSYYQTSGTCQAYSRNPLDIYFRAGT